jgi:hypothetical protein
MKILQKEITGTQTSFFPPILVVNWVSSSLSFFLSASTAATYTVFSLFLHVQLLELVSKFVH